MIGNLVSLRGWVLAAVMVMASSAGATTYYVATTGNNSNNGTSTTSPFLTIQKAADVMQPGDMVLIRGGTYREKITPPRGGSSENQRITYKAYTGETPVVKGSERITNWVSQGNGVWKVDIADSYFGTYNPYTTTFNDVTHSWCHNLYIHTGQVYFNDVEFKELFVDPQVAINTTPNSWRTTHGGTTTTIYANFGSNNPNTGLAEINVRQQVFKPSVTGIGYITLDGLTIEQGATQWVEPNSYQDGMISTFWGKAWIIQNCHVYYAKTVGIMSGNIGTSISKSDLTTYGQHIIRNNLIEKCGENGIAGQSGWNRSIIENNIIQNINQQNLISGIELACIKTHHAIDVIIRNNIFRRMNKGPNGDSQGYGIWLDYECQGNRITGNLFYEMELTTAIVFVEASHGPNLLDNNIMVGNRIFFYAERDVVAHNLFVRAFFKCKAEPDRSTSYFTPHTFSSMGRVAMSNGYDKFYNNILSEPCANTDVFTGPNTSAGGNVQYNGSNTIGGTGSVSNNTYNPNFSITELTNGARVNITVNAAPFDAVCPLITRSFIGVFTPMNQGIENPDGSAITIDRDMLGNARSSTDPVAGPFETLIQGSNSFTITAGIVPGVTKIKKSVSPSMLHSTIQNVLYTLVDIQGRLIARSVKPDQIVTRSGTCFLVQKINGKPVVRKFVSIH